MTVMVTADSPHRGVFGPHEYAHETPRGTMLVSAFPLPIFAFGARAWISAGLRSAHGSLGNDAAAALVERPANRAAATMRGVIRSFLCRFMFPPKLVRASSLLAQAVSTRRPAFARSSGCAGWWRSFSHRPPPAAHPPN